ncbi:MAG: Zn-dependent hydrolase [Planctomycetaceae bacterium]
MTTRFLALLVTSLLVAPALAQNAANLNKKYATVKLEADLSDLSENQKKLLVHLIEAGKLMDQAFWQQAYGNRRALMGGLKRPAQKKFARINYGPWDRLDGNKPFVDDVREKPAGANFYPLDMAKDEFEKHIASNPRDEAKFKSLYTVVRRNTDGRLYSVPYRSAYGFVLRKAAAQLEEAAALAEDDGFRQYLTARAKALRDDKYQPSDLLWMDMKSNQIDCVIGPIETYEDQLFGYKAAFECYVLIKDMAWSERLSKYAALLPKLQEGLPVEDKYKQEKPGSNSDLNAYDVVYYAGDCNAGSKTIAINLPNDEEVQLAKGSRRLQLKNTMQAKFDTILVPLAEKLIVEDQRKHITFNAFFSNTMFHEVAHGLGIKNTITGKGTVRDALRETSSALEEGKADILGLYMIDSLLDSGELTEGDRMDYYVTFMGSVFRSVRFGASSAHGKANMIRFNFFKERGAFTRGEDGLYRINPDALKKAATELTQVLLRLQGDGDYAAAAKFVEENAFVGATLQADLERLNAEGIPVDIVFEQGAEVLGLK